jgi:hypothetical protein
MAKATVPVLANAFEGLDNRASRRESAVDRKLYYSLRLEREVGVEDAPGSQERSRSFR